MKFNYKELDKEKGRAIVKVSIGRYYVITKCGTIDYINDEITTMARRYSKNIAGISTESLYFKFIRATVNSKLEGKIEVLFQSNNGYELLKKELELLCEHFGKRFCLNSSNIPYIPKTIHANKGSNWLKKNEYLNFMKLLKKYDA